MAQLAFVRESWTPQQKDTRVTKITYFDEGNNGVESVHVWDSEKLQEEEYVCHTSDPPKFGFLFYTAHIITC